MHRKDLKDLTSAPSGALCSCGGKRNCVEQMLRASRSSQLDISTLSSHTNYNPSPYMAVALYCILQYCILYTVLESAKANIMLNFFLDISSLSCDLLMKYPNVSQSHPLPCPYTHVTPLTSFLTSPLSLVSPPLALCCADIDINWQK